MKKMKKLFAMAVTAAFTVSMLAGCGQSAEITDASAQETTQETETDAADEETAGTADAASEDTAERTTFTVGFDAEFPPYGYMDENGEYTGFDLELAQEVADRLGLEFVPQPIAWDAKDMELSSGTIDCIWNGFTMNGREDDYTWSTPYMDNSQVFVVAADSGISSLADLAGKVVEVQTDSSAEAALKDNAELSATFGTLQTTPDYNTAFMDLEMGAVDAIAMDVIVAGYQHWL